MADIATLPKPGHRVARGAEQAALSMIASPLLRDYFLEQLRDAETTAERNATLALIQSMVPQTRPC